jgi:hypothetical protein
MKCVQRTTFLSGADHLISLVSDLENEEAHLGPCSQHGVSEESHVAPYQSQSQALQ